MSDNIQELLPFYVNGTLSDSEKAKVEEAISSNPALRDEIAYLESLRSEVKAQEIEASPGELGLKRLQKSIAGQSHQDDIVSRTMAKTAPEQNNKIWRLVAIAACLLLIVQTAVGTSLWQQDDDLNAAGGGYNLFVTGKIISVTFVPEAREESIRGLLLSVDARIIDGPTALGVYKLGVTQDVDMAIKKLLAHRNLIETAQPANSN